ncbi:MAG: GspE/PulE family protein [Patescibacteria group bacterium]|nr:GspE/PulE family protein [Patescibacteria group bacterium]
MTKVEAELAKGRNISIIDLVQNLIEHAYEINASDVHIDPVEEEILVRLRIDGVLISSFTLPKIIHSEIISRIKVLAGLRTDVHHTPQDGRFRIDTITGGFLDIRISVMPTYYGENAVFRILAKKVENFTLENLGMRDIDVTTITKAIHKPNGMILVTGPTGSGKTTTLYTLIQMLNKSDRCLMTIEDPIEYSIKGIKQIQINSETGLSFAKGLRAMLRQDPNIIMVGEIRDEETARIAVNISLTGHLLLSTLHTNDSASTLPRLLDMKIDAYLIASTVSVVVAQRLVRRICEHCIHDRKITEIDKQKLKEILSKPKITKIKKLYFGKGCDKCANTGFRGRIGVYEVMQIDNKIKDAIVRKSSAREIKNLAIKNGMQTMLEDGLSKAFQGLTTVEEVLRIIHE